MSPSSPFAFDDHFVRAFWHWGLVVHKMRWPLFIGPFLLTAFLSLGFRWIREQETKDPLFVFSPENARWRFERAVLSEYWPLDEQHFWPGKSYDYNGYVDVIAAGRREAEHGDARPNMLLSTYLNELERINKFIIHNLTVPVLLSPSPSSSDSQNSSSDPSISSEFVGFTDLCMSYAWKCFENDHITMLQPKGRWTGGLQADIVELAKEIIEQEVHITYPIGWRGTEPIYFGALVGGVHLTDSEGHFDYASAVRLTYNVRDGPIGQISKRWRKRLAEFLTDKMHPASDLLEFGLYHNESLPEGLQDVADTLTPKLAGCCLLLFLFCLGCSIVLLSNPRSGRLLGIDWVRSKPLLGLAALLCPVLAILSAFGLLLWTGSLYNAIVNVSPFIVLCIGIDDAFLMTAAWHRTNPELRTGRRLAETLAEAAVAISITSFTDMLTFGIGCFTTLPGVRLFCLYTFFGIAFTYLYQITYFAAVMAFAGEMEEAGRHSLLFGIPTLRPEMADTFLKRILMAGSNAREGASKEKMKRKGNAQAEEDAEGMKWKGKAEREEDAEGRKWKGKAEGEEDAEGLKQKDKQGEDGEEMKRKENAQAEDDAEGSESGKAGDGQVRKAAKWVDWLKSAEDATDQGRHSHHGRETFVNKLFREVYGPFLLTRRTKMYVFLCYSLFALFALLGVFRMKEGMDPKMLVRSSFYLTDFYVLIDETFWQEGLQLQVVVNNPPDLFDPTQRRRLDEMLTAFEGTEFTMGHNATLFWLNAFDAHLEQEKNTQNITLPQTSGQWYGRCREWLLVAGGRRLWELDMDWEQTEEEAEAARTVPRLRAFRLQIGLRNYRTPTDHTNGCRLMRSIAAQFPEFNVTTFHEYYPFADQYLELKPALYRNCLLAVVCMMAVSFLMIPSWPAAFAITAAIISIDLGVLGYMSLWGVNLESVSMITIIMSIGFSVDLSAHITYAYAKAPKGLSRDQRAIAALETLGWPVFLVCSDPRVPPAFPFQGAFSTVVGILVLTLVDAHIILIFFKTVFLVITFSLLHGIVFLPILLTVAMPKEKDGGGQGIQGGEEEGKEGRRD